MSLLFILMFLIVGKNAFSESTTSSSECIKGFIVTNTVTIVYEEPMIEEPVIEPDYTDESSSAQMTVSSLLASDHDLPPEHRRGMTLEEYQELGFGTSITTQEDSVATSTPPAKQQDSNATIYDHPAEEFNPTCILIDPESFLTKLQKKIINVDSILSIYNTNGTAIVRVSKEETELPRIDIVEDNFQIISEKIQQAVNCDQTPAGVIKGFILLHSASTVGPKEFLLNVDYIQSLTSSDEGTLIATKILRPQGFGNILPGQTLTPAMDKQTNLYYVEETLEEVEELLRLSQS